MQNPSISRLPDLSSRYALSPEQITSFQQNGHVLLRGVAPEIGAYRPVIAEAALRYNTEKEGQS